MRVRRIRGVFVLALVPLAVPAVQEGPARPDARSFPAHDVHQGVAIAAVPVVDAPEAEKIFGKTMAPTQAGFMPVELIITNEREEAIRVNLERIVVFSDRAKLEQVDTEAVALGLYPLPKAKDPRPKPRPRLPIPLPRGSGVPKDKKREEREEAAAALRARQLRAAVVAPGGFARGYLFFDLRNTTIDMEKGSVYIPEVATESGTEKLLFFEISLEPYAE